MHGRHYQALPLELLPTFEAAARNLSLTKAGAELHLTQSAVSRRIQALEKALGVRLFERKTRALQLTSAGLDLMRAAQEVLERIEAVVRSLAATPEVRTVTLTTTPGFASLWLIPRLAGFTEAYPGVDVRTSATNQVVDLVAAGVDLAIRYCPATDNPAGQRLFGGKMMPVCSPQLLKQATRRLVEPGDLRSFTLLYLDDPHTAWFDWSIWFQALGIANFRPARRLHFSHYDQMIQAAVGGQGIALGLDPLVRGLLGEGRLVAPLKNASVPTRTWYLLRSAASARKPDVDAFQAWLLKEIRADRRKSLQRSHSSATVLR